MNTSEPRKVAPRFTSLATSSAPLSPLDAWFFLDEMAALAQDMPNRDAMLTLSTFDSKVFTALGGNTKFVPVGVLDPHKDVLGDHWLGKLVDIIGLDVEHTLVSVSMPHLDMVATLHRIISWPGYYALVRSYNADEFSSPFMRLTDVFVFKLSNGG